MARNLLLFFIFCGSCMPASGQIVGESRVRIIFYNVENLFDVNNDSLKLDDEFTPAGAKHWTYSRYQAKLTHIYKTLTAASGWEPAAIVGLCEVENLRTLEDLVSKTPLKKFNYQIIHKESPDPRGIDVALLYRRELFRPIAYEPMPVAGRSPGEWFSREILYVKGILFETDTIHLFVNHWPSRASGQRESEGKRLFAASLLRTKSDSLHRYTNDPLVVIMGDLNDNPDDRSLRFLTGERSRLENQMTDLYQKGEGTLTFHDAFLQWHLFDQFIVSESLTGNTGLRVEKAGIFKASWLYDRKTGRPFRTYQGPVYLGGFSDHFPVFLDLYK